MKHFVTILLLTVCLHSAYAQTDSSLYKSYSTMFDKNYDKLDPIEGIWQLNTTSTDISKKTKQLLGSANYTVAIYKVDKFFKVQYLTKDFHQMERFLRIDNSSKLLYDLPDEQITARTEIEENTIRVSYTTEVKNKTHEEQKIFIKIYPESSTTKSQR